MTAPDLDFYSVGFVFIPNDMKDPEGEGKTLRYSEFVRRLFKQQTPELMKSHAAIGLAGEAGEAADAVKRDIIYNHTHTPEGKTIREALIEELGDLSFYMQATMQLYEITGQEVIQHNAVKLAERYKKLEYSDKAAAERADKKGE